MISMMSSTYWMEFGLITMWLMTTRGEGFIPKRTILVGLLGLKDTPTRYRDFTPTKVSPGSGGADFYLQFLKTELIPVIDKKFHTKIERSALVGGSLGGLFLIHALLNEPTLFKSYVDIVESPAGSGPTRIDGGDSVAMNFPAEHIERIKEHGYTESEARFLYIVAVHSGYFNLGQVPRFHQYQLWETPDVFCAKALAAGSRHRARLHARGLYLSSLLEDRLRPDRKRQPPQPQKAFV
jgi:hypothetical protein